MISFIHIGKTGGTTINTLISNKIKIYKEYHLHKNYNEDDEKYIIWLRNPISRFVSAFNHSFYGVTIDINSIEKFDLEHCLIPMWMKNAKDKLYVFSEKYDMLVKSFKNANELAESLSSEDLQIQQKAKDLMNCTDEHLYKGIGWYLDNGNFITKNNNKILFVGRMENMKEDINELSKKLNINLNDDLKLRENIYVDTNMKYLSPLAIKNIVEWYKNSDYKALEQLLIHGWISQENLHLYYLYND
jgi:hypothetical protein